MRMIRFGVGGSDVHQEWCVKSRTLRAGNYLDPCVGQALLPLANGKTYIRVRTGHRAALGNAALRQRFNIGDVFEVVLGDGKVGHFQYIAVDDTQLSSAVIRAFVGAIDQSDAPNVDRILERSVSFYAHVFLKAGLTLNLWQKVGHATPPQAPDVVFRVSADYGNPTVLVSHNWYVWRINEPMQGVGRLPEKFHHAEIGVVKAPQEIASRIRSGRYAGVFPDY